MTTATYDPDGNLLTSTDPDGVTTTDTYTPLDQVATTSYSDGTHEATYTYDANGNEVGMTDGSGTSSFTFDPFGEMTSEEDGAGATTSYSYDSEGDTTAVTYPLPSGETWSSSDTVHYGYDQAGNLTSITDFDGVTTTVANTADSLPSSLSFGSTGDTLSTSYDPTDAPSSITLSNGSTLDEFAYSDVPSGAVLSETDTPTSVDSPADYTYDAEGRVTEETPGSSSSLPYGYDDSDNLTTLPNGATGTYDDASELTASVKSSSTTDYTYSADGERTAESGGATVSASYNGAEELTSYDDSAADQTSATYNGEGLRTVATATPSGGSSETEHFTWDTAGSEPELLMDSWEAYIDGPTGIPLEQVNLSNGRPEFLIDDALGSVRAVIDGLSGGIQATTSYDAWGNPEGTSLAAETPFGFAGGYTDPTGLIYLINRYYDPTTGQFLSVDPSVDVTREPYAYTGDDPVNGVDPLGLAKKPTISQVAAALAAATALSRGASITESELGGYTNQADECAVATAAQNAAVATATAVDLVVAAAGLGAGGAGLSESDALAILEEAGIPAATAASYLQSFSGSLTLRQVETGEQFLRYTSAAESQGRFLTQTEFSSSSGAVSGLDLAPYGNTATFVQTVTALRSTVVLQGGVAGGAEGVDQELVTELDAFDFGTGEGVDD